MVEVVVNHTGYPADFVELDQDLEGELGIDTVKQAEIMAEIRERFGLPVDEDFVLADYPTLNHMIGYIQRMTGGAPSVSAPAPEPVPPPAAPPTPVPAPLSSAPPVPAPIPTPSAPPVDDAAMTQTVVEVVVEHTGYPADFIELDKI